MVTVNSPLVARLKRLFLSPTNLLGMVCVGAAVIGVKYIYIEDRDALAKSLKEGAPLIKSATETELNRALTAITNLSLFYQASSSVDLDEFAIMTAPYFRPGESLQGGMIEAIGWLPVDEDTEKSYVKTSEGGARFFDQDQLSLPFLRERSTIKNASNRIRYFPVSTFPLGNEDHEAEAHLTLVATTIRQLTLQESLARRNNISGFLAVEVSMPRLFAAVQEAVAPFEVTSAQLERDGAVYQLLPEHDDHAAGPATEHPEETGASEIVETSMTVEGMNLRLSYREVLDPAQDTFLERKGAYLAVELGIIFALLLLIWMQSRQQAASRRARFEAERSNKLKSEFLAMMSHEIRTPLNGILGMSDLVQKTKLTDAQREHLVILNKSAEGLLAIINEILDFSKIEADRLEVDPIEANLTDLLELTIRNTNVQAAAKGIELMVSYPLTLPRKVVIDELRLRQMLNNLCSNAIKFTPSGGRIVIRVEEDTQKREGENRRWVNISVEDSGIGIKPDRIDAIFQPFRQVDASTTRNYGGTGLGLTISRRLAQLMGGNVTCTSVVGEGSTFTISLPLETVQGVSDNRRALAPLVLFRALVMTTDPLIRESTQMAVAAAGLDTAFAGSADEATAMLAEAEQAGDAFDLVLIDRPAADAGQQFEIVKGLSQPPRLVTLRSSRMTMLDHRMDIVKGTDDTFSLPLIPERLASRLSHLMNDMKLKNRIEGSGEAASDAASAPPANPLEGVRVLLTEDDRINQIYAEGLLSGFGCVTVKAENGAVALEIAEREEFDIILMDCQMPVMDGFTATKQLKLRMNTGELKETPIVALTANAVKGDRQACLDVGMDDYATKPIREPILQQIIQKWVPRTQAARPAPTPAAIPDQTVTEEPAAPPTPEPVAPAAAIAAPVAAAEQPPTPSAAPPAAVAPQEPIPQAPVQAAAPQPAPAPVATVDPAQATPPIAPPEQAATPAIAVKPDESGSAASQAASPQAIATPAIAPQSPAPDARPMQRAPAQPDAPSQSAAPQAIANAPAPQQRAAPQAIAAKPAAPQKAPPQAVAQKAPPQAAPRKTAPQAIAPKAAQQPAAQPQNAAQAPRPAIAPRQDAGQQPQAVAPEPAAARQEPPQAIAEQAARPRQEAPQAIAQPPAAAPQPVQPAPTQQAQPAAPATGQAAPQQAVAPQPVRQAPPVAPAQAAPPAASPGPALQQPAAPAVTPTPAQPTADAGQVEDENSDLPVLDTGIFAQTRQAMGDRFSMILDLFREDGQKYLDEIKASVTGSDFSGCMRAAHTLKSSSKMIGAMKLSARSESIQELSKSATPDGGAIAHHATRLEQEFLEALREVDTAKAA